MSTLGRLEEVDLRKEWPNEASHFTPWLARDENLALLGETLGLELELEGLERAVGPFRADILCKDMGRDEWVLVENQLEQTDHRHLGQVLTYAAGLDAATIVWIAARFTQEHRATLDWLNRITDENFRFFALEVQLWRIGDSLSAPKFNIVSQPNEWSRSVKSAARSMDDSAKSPLQLMQTEYWEQLGLKLQATGGPLSGPRAPQPQSWMAYSIGRGGITCNAAISRPQNHIRAEIYLSGPNAAREHAQLSAWRDALEQELGFAMEWPEMTGKRDRRIFVALPMENFEDRADWDRQHRWLVEKLGALHKVFSAHVKRLPR